MSTVIFLTSEQIAQAKHRIAGRHLFVPRFSSAELKRRRKHARRMVAFAARKPVAA